jgi:hypothetical protein
MMLLVYVNRQTTDAVVVKPVQNDTCLLGLDRRTQENLLVYVNRQTTDAVVVKPVQNDDAYDFI